VATNLEKVEKSEFENGQGKSWSLKVVRKKSGKCVLDWYATTSSAIDKINITEHSWINYF